MSFHRNAKLGLLAYTEIHNDQRAATIVGSLERTLASHARHGTSTQRLMTDNA